jgi:3-oxoacyl-[acyl-carrier protein] reductase
MEVARHGITANCVAPGLINAGMFLTVDPEYQESISARIPVGRLGSPEDVATCVKFLTSAESGYVTGQTLTVCGGLSLGF